MIEDSQTPEAEPNTRECGPTDGPTLEDAPPQYNNSEAYAWLSGYEAGRAALLATRDRYEAALRRIAAKGHPHGESYYRPDWCHVCMAREALAGAPEETP